ncbi:MAG: hypothetical protein PUD59_03220 [bacterium]|nr:hypothetical protein [bacterium]
MNDINYRENANSQLKKYDLAIEDIDSAIQKLEECIKELNKIVGFESVENLKKDLVDKISYLNVEKNNIQKEKTKIYNQSVYLQNAQNNP